MTGREKKIMTAFVSILTMVIIVCIQLTPVYATDRNGGDITMNEGSYNRNLLTLPNISTDEKTQISRQTVYLDEAAKARASQSELRFTASVKVGANGSRTNTRELTVQCYNSAGNYIQGWTQKSDSYSVSHHWNTFTISDKVIPSGTAYITYYVYNHIGTSGRLETENCSFVITDTVSPSVTMITASTDDGRQLSETHAAGTKITYEFRFSERVFLNTYPTLKMDPVSDQAGFTGESVLNGRTVMYKEYIIPSTGSVISDSSKVALLGTGSFTFRDDQGNSITKTFSESDISALNSAIGKNGRVYMDNRPPELIRVSSQGFSSDSVLTEGNEIQFHLTFHENIISDGTASIRLNNGAVVSNIINESTTNTADFIYTVRKGDDVDRLGIMSCDLSGITDEVRQAAASSNAYDTFINRVYDYMNDYQTRIDTTAPYVTEFSDAQKRYGKEVSVEIQVQDDGCGVSVVQYGWTEDAVNPLLQYSDAKNIDGLYRTDIPMESGDWYLYVICEDHAGNVSEPIVSEHPFSYDLSAPEISLGTTMFEGQIIAVNCTVTDADPVYPEVTFTWKDIETDTAVETGILSDNGPVPFPLQSGVYALEIKAQDSLNNISQQSVEVLADRDVPELSLTCDTTGYRQNHVSVVHAQDAHTAVSSIQYRWIQGEDRDEPWITLVETDEIGTPENENGDWTLQVRAYDMAGNMAWTSGICQLDNTAPTVKFTPDGNENRKGEASYEVHASVEDDISAVSALTVRYAITENENMPEEWVYADDPSNLSFMLEMDSDLFIHILVTDECGNETYVVSKKFEKDNEAPSGSIAHDGNGYVYTAYAKCSLTAADHYISDDRITMQVKVDEEEWTSWQPFTKTLETAFADVEGTHVIAVRFRDIAGNVSEIYQVEIIYDITPPLIFLDYSTTEKTKEDVTVTASVNEGEADWCKAQTYTFRQNGTHLFTFTDPAGNTSQKKAEVTWIDQKAPVFTLQCEQADTKAHQNAVFTMTCEDPDFAYYQYRLGEQEVWNDVNGNTFEITGLDGTYLIEVKAMDDVGNSSSQTESVRFDNTAPVMKPVYTPDHRTGSDVRMEWTFEDAGDVKVMEPEKDMTSFTFEDNGKQLFRFVDEAGNIGEFEAEVNWIDRNLPKADVVIRNTDGEIRTDDVSVNTPVTVQIIPKETQEIVSVMFDGDEIHEGMEGVEVLEQPYTYRISMWGVLSYRVLDRETQIEGEEETVIRVDTQAPVCEETDVWYSTQSWTNDNVTVRISPRDDHSSKITFLTLEKVEEGKLEYTVDEKADTYVFETNGSHTFFFKDEAGNVGKYTVTVNWIDREIPVPTVIYTTDEGTPYDPQTWTNRNVHAAIVFESLSPVEGSFEHVFESNGTWNVEFEDLAGNRGSMIITIDHIDQTAPTGTFTSDMKGYTNQNVTVVLHAFDEASGTQDMTYVFEENGTHVFQLYDNAGNMREYTFTCDRIDTQAPELTVIYTPQNNGTTPFGVTAIAESDEPVEWKDGLHTYRFEENGTYVFEAVDRAGNVSSITADVNWISKELPAVQVQYSTTEPVSGKVTAILKTVNVNERIVVRNNNGSACHVFEENGSFTYRYTDGKGNVIGTVEAVVDWIDNEKPVIAVSTDRDELSNAPLRITFTSDEDVIWPEMLRETTERSAVYTLESAVPLSFSVTDLTGNRTDVIFNTDLIDTTPPEMTLKQEKTVTPVGNPVDLKDNVSIQDDNLKEDGLTITEDVDFNTPGSYEVIYTAQDQAGNITERNMTVTVYDPDAPQVFINGQRVDDTCISIAQSENLFETTGFAEDMKVWMLKGRKKKGDFKTSGVDIHDGLTDGSHVFESTGYHTLLVQDSERQTKLIEVYVERNR
ncbi:MAG: immunoglobulin-like domain-containing protein [Bulleidia sp.]